jgi:Sulfotransferase domain
MGIQSLGRYPLSLILSYLEEIEGISLLICCKRFAANVLPLFRRKEAEILSRKKQRYKFIEYPVQDPDLLLQRLNTRRLRWRMSLARSRKLDSRCYEYNMTTRELAIHEWQSQKGPQKWPAALELLRFRTRIEPFYGTSLLVSYPRSGNTMIRHALERLSGVVTGSDTRPDRKLSRDLATHLVGEGVVTRQVSIVKTHYPERTGWRVQAHRAIVLIRNPYDTIDSYWNLCLTNTHTETVTDDVYQSHYDFWKRFTRNEMKVWIRFHRFWLEAKIPVLFVRFEDYLNCPQRELLRMAEFLNVDISRVSHSCDSNFSIKSSYRPRTMGQPAFGKALRRYSESMLSQFHDIAEEQPGWNNLTMLQYFGYDIKTQEFPGNFYSETLPPMAVAEVGGKVKTLDINAGYELREKFDMFGRSMKQWRLDHTNGDQAPFPIVERD